MLTVGDPAPWFEARSPVRPDFRFSQAGGRIVVLTFFGSAAEPGMRAMLAALRGEAGLFNDDVASLFAVSCDPLDETERRLEERLPGFHVFWDPSGAIPRLYGLADEGNTRLRCSSFVLDANLRVLAVLPIRDPATHAAEVIDVVARLPPQDASGTAPVLVVPRIFEPQFCRRLIAGFEAGESSDSGFMTTDPVTGMTVLRHDHAHKRRRDLLVEDEDTLKHLRVRLLRRLVPEIRKAFQFHATRIERYLLARYDAEDGGHFRPHRDNTTKGTAHRRFAVTINLNAEDYDGGDLRFPEYGRRTWRAPTGGGIVFSCSLLHEALPVTQGRRYAFLPFLYDDAAAKIRDENLKFVAPLSR